MTLDYQVKQNSYITFNHISVFPNNQGLLGQYSIKFTPKRALGAGGVIKIQMPSELQTLPTNVVCELQGGLNSF